MKIYNLQPPYPQDSSVSASLSCMQWILEQLNGLQPGEADIVLLPEYSNCPGVRTRVDVEQMLSVHSKNFINTLSDCAKRTHAIIAVGTALVVNGELRNRTLIFGYDGDEAGFYDKTHLTAFEREDLGIIPGSKLGIVCIGGIKIGVATCLDIYFPEYIEALASAKIDLLLCPSYQRSESSQRIRSISSCRALDCGAYIARSSYAMQTPGYGGHSLIASPDGKIITDLEETSGSSVIDIDLSAKFIKPASHGAELIEHRTLIEANRRTGLYRPAYDRAVELNAVPFPRICAHRGLRLACPENTIPAFAAAISIGADEIEFDLRLSRDGIPVVCHDDTLDRTTDLSGPISSLSWEEISKADAGCKINTEWSGIHIPRWQDVVDAAGGRITMNIHVYAAGPNGSLVRMVCDLIRERCLIDTAYIAGDEDVMLASLEYAPEIPRACLAFQNQPDKMIDAAIEWKCSRVQFSREAKEHQIHRAREAGLICNLFWSNDPTDAQEYVDRGIQVVLSDCAHQLVGRLH